MKGKALRGLIAFGIILLAIWIAWWFNFSPTTGRVDYALEDSILRGKKRAQIAKDSADKRHSVYRSSEDTLTRIRNEIKDNVPAINHKRDSLRQSSKQEPTRIAPDTLTVNDRYERMLLDSLIVLEALKPVHSKLEDAYEARGKEIESVWELLRLSELQIKMQKQQAEVDRRNAKRQQRKALLQGIGIGIPIGLLITIIAH